MAKYVELRRHTDADGDALTPEGVSAAFIAPVVLLVGANELLTVLVSVPAVHAVVAARPRARR
jgi:hypothetical protein